MCAVTYQYLSRFPGAHTALQFLLFGFCTPLVRDFWDLGRETWDHPKPWATYWLIQPLSAIELPAIISAIYIKKYGFDNVEIEAWDDLRRTLHTHTLLAFTMLSWLGYFHDPVSTVSYLLCKHNVNIFIATRSLHS